MSIYKGKGIKNVTILLSTGASVDLPFGNTFTCEPEVDDITYEGDGQTETEYVNMRLGGEIGGDKFSEEVLEALYGKTAVTSGLPSGEAKRYYFGENADLAGTQVAFIVDMYAIEDSAETEETIRLNVFKAKVSPFTPPEGSNADKWAPITFTWTAEKTLTDIEGTALPGVPADGAFYSVGVLS